RHRPRPAPAGGEAEPLYEGAKRPAAGAVRTGRRAGTGPRGAPVHRPGGAEVRPCARAAVRRQGTGLPARGLRRRPGARRRHAVHRAPRGRAVPVRLVAVRGPDLPQPDRLDLGQRPAGLGWRAAGWRRGGAAPGVRPLSVRLGLAALLACVLAAPPSPAAAQAAGGSGDAPATAADPRIVFPESVQQGALVIGKVPAGSTVMHAGRELRVTGYGTVAFGVARDQSGPVTVQVRRPDGSRHEASIRVTARDWPVERVSGVPPKTVSPPKEIAERIAREQARVAEARTLDGNHTGFAERFQWPVQGRISGRFGNHRVYNGTPGAPHSGMDIAAASGTPVKAP